MAYGSLFVSQTDYSISYIYSEIETIEANFLLQLVHDSNIMTRFRQVLAKIYRLIRHIEEYVPALPESMQAQRIIRDNAEFALDGINQLQGWKDRKHCAKYVLRSTSDRIKYAPPGSAVRILNNAIFMQVYVNNLNLHTNLYNIMNAENNNHASNYPNHIFDYAKKLIAQRKKFEAVVTDGLSIQESERSRLKALDDLVTLIKVFYNFKERVIKRLRQKEEGEEMLQLGAEFDDYLYELVRFFSPLSSSDQLTGIAVSV